ncbi:MAG: HAD hydrolase-like protein [Firmicutes bacterium]|nr:HAD hydrolase-like protein [Bacillota bacterium]
MTYDIYLFDLDGTLTDPKPSITKSVQYALKHFGIDEPDLSKLERFIGPPLSEGFSTFYNMSDTDAELASQKYREHYSKILFENEVYKGIPELLEGLKARGKTLGVATLKLTHYAVPILQHFNLLDYFALVKGFELDGYMNKKCKIINYILSHLDPDRKQSVVMIGDRMQDIIAAKDTGIKSIGLTYGYGTYEELKSAGADYIVNSVAELQKMLNV